MHHACAARLEVRRVGEVSSFVSDKLARALALLQLSDARGLVLCRERIVVSAAHPASVADWACALATHIGSEDKRGDAIAKVVE